MCTQKTKLEREWHDGGILFWVPGSNCQTSSRGETPRLFVFFFYSCEEGLLITVAENRILRPVPSVFLFVFLRNLSSKLHLFDGVWHSVVELI